MKQQSSRSRGAAALLAAAAVAGCAFFLWLGCFDLIDPDEGRHAEIAREMLVSGHYLTPRLHGLPYYDKPVLFHWALAASMSLFGQTAAAVRLPSALSGLLTVVFAGCWAFRAYGPGAALLAVAGLSTTLSFVAVSRFVVIDPLLVCIMTAALVWLGLWFTDDEARRRSIYPFYVLVGLGTLAKGPVVLAIPGAVALVMLTLGRRWSCLASLRVPSGAALAAAVAVPWYLAAWLSDPAYIETFLWHHNIERYLGSAHIGHQSPWYYYLVALPLGLLPWFPWVAAGVWRKLSDPQRSDADLYTLIWAGVVLVFFLPARTKLLTYVLPAFPPLLCLGAAYAAGKFESKQPFPAAFRAFAFAWIALLVLVMSAAAPAAWWWAPQACTGLLAGLASLLLLPLVRQAWRARDDKRLALYMVLASLGLLVLVYGPAAIVQHQERGMRSAALALEGELEDGRPLLAYEISPHSLAFYSRHVLWRSSDPVATRQMMRESGAWALVTRERYLDDLGLDPLPPGVRPLWSGGGGRVVVAGEGRVEEHE